MALPFLGSAFRADEQLALYLRASTTGANPFSVAREVAGSLGGSADRGYFRPVGQFAEWWSHGLIFKASDATGLAPHVVSGMARLALIGLVALIAGGMVWSLARSAGVALERFMVAAYPVAVGVVLVAHGTAAGIGGGGVISFPVTSIGAVAVTLGAARLTARDHDLSARAVRGREYMALALLGTVLAAFGGTALMGPAVIGAFVAARMLAQGRPLREWLATAALRRCAALWAGFVAVWALASIEVGRRCAGRSCSGDLSASLGRDTLEVALGRFVHGLPAAGWAASTEAAAASGLGTGLGQAMRSPMVLASLAGLALLSAAAVSARLGWYRAAGTDGSGAAHDQLGTSQRSLATPSSRLAGVLVGFGLAVAGIAALFGGTSPVLGPLGSGQRLDWAWNDTLLAQFGWSFVIGGGLAALDVLLRTEAARRAAAVIAMQGLGLSEVAARRADAVGIARAVSVSVLAVGAALTFAANWQTAQAARLDPAASAASIIATTTVLAADVVHDRDAIARLNDWPDATPAATAASADDAERSRWGGVLTGVRCDVLDAFETRPGGEVTAQRLRAALDDLMLDRYGLRYCDPDGAEPQASATTGEGRP